eukprot:CAMPEP_0119217346 /NCGR_PEP_ID=MMETSP1327-20130426/17796_1 /TAXON_ID=38833 /ORGANISM="Micromonas pusilla, Strain RCC2306" /LENGTH=81 /DNA_ID=CAMNT_0007215303 /DNA_START=140 /DNA_END=385 /DNA_ORIENTATION=+
MPVANTTSMGITTKHPSFARFPRVSVPASAGAAPSRNATKLLERSKSCENSSNIALVCIDTNARDMTADVRKYGTAGQVFV